MFENIKFGDLYKTKSGKIIVFSGKLNNYFIFMFENNMEISLYDADGVGPYLFGLGSGTVIKTTKLDNIVGKIN